MFATINDPEHTKEGGRSKSMGAMTIRLGLNLTMAVAALIGIISLPDIVCAQAPETKGNTTLTDGLPYSHDYRVVEFRRYTIKPGQRDNFARYFDTWFPEAFQQLGALAIGEFLEREQLNGFTWMRGFKTIEDRAMVNAAFYYGPVWKEHGATLNALMDDSDNVLLLTPLDPDRGLAVLPAVDPVSDRSGSHGRVVAQIFRVSKGRVSELAGRVSTAFEKYRAAGVSEAAILVSLEVPNNFPILPIRTDGPYLVWVGVVPDDAAQIFKVETLMGQSARELSRTGLLQGNPEVIIMTPTERSRLRWRSGVSTPPAPSPKPG